MTTDRSTARFPYGIILFFTLFIVFLFILIALLTIETHSAKFAKDYNCLGGHACPVGRIKELQKKLPLSPTRPDEDILWKQCSANFMNAYEKRLQHLNQDDKIILSNSSNTERYYFFLYENHYRVEVRRTILELEAKHPLFVSPIYSSYEDYDLLGYSNIVYSRSCEPNVSDPAYSHDRGRTDTIIWYIRHGIFPVNYEKQYFPLPEKIRK